MKSILEIAHRGHSYKDNSLNAFFYAIKEKFDMIELDIQITKDNQIVVFHDTYISKTGKSSRTNLSSTDHDFIIDLTLEEIKEIDSKIISLNEFFENIDPKDNLIYLDIKGSKKIVPFLLSLLEKYDTTNIYIGAFNILMIEALSKIRPDLNYGIISETMFTSDIIDLITSKYNIKFFCFHWSVLQHDEINYLKNKDILVFSYTNKFDIILKRMMEFNIDGIVSNFKIT